MSRSFVPPATVNDTLAIILPLVLVIVLASCGLLRWRSIRNRKRHMGEEDRRTAAVEAQPEQGVLREVSSG